jgi:hypothetical protein
MVVPKDTAEVINGPSIFWDYCQYPGVPTPNTSTAADVFTNKILCSFAFQVFEMGIKAPASSIQWSPDLYNNARLAEAFSECHLSAPLAEHTSSYSKACQCCALRGQPLLWGLLTYLQQQEQQALRDTAAMLHASH